MSAGAIGSSSLRAHRDLESQRQKNHLLLRVRMLFRLDLAFHGLYKARTSRQAVSNASVGTDHPLSQFSGCPGTTLDECRSNAVDHS
jgi:hypothetical protein